jgi:6-phosphogluconolactonase
VRQVFASTDQLAAELVRMTIEAANAAIIARGSFSMALTGGSAATTLYPVLAQAALPWEKVHIFFGDERCVPPDHADSNYGLANKVFLSKVSIPPGNIHRMMGEIEPDKAAKEYELELAKIGGAIDVLHLGMGPDGHVLSLFPGHALLENNDLVTYLTDSPKPPPSRVTLGLAAVKKARAVWFLVAGENKREAVRDAIFDANSKLPAAIAARSNSDVRWLLDDAAARLLKTG